MKRKTQILVFALVLGACLVAYKFDDPILRLELRSLWPMNLSGFAVLIKAPDNASIEDVIRSSGQFQNFRIIETKKFASSTVAWVDSEKGEKLVFVQHDGQQPNNWCVQVRETW